MTDKIIPFGKHKGRPIDEVLAIDPQYVQWLEGQAWFAERFGDLKVIINNFHAEPAETPEHNAMQVAFLDERLRWQVIKAVHGHDPATLAAMLTAQAAKSRAFVESLSLKEEDFERCSFHPERSAEQRQARIDRFEKTRAASLAELADVKMNIQMSAASFEVGVDVEFRLGVFRNVACLEREGSYPYEREVHVYESGEHDRKSSLLYQIAVECKPSVGDDFPAVLRQMHQQRVRKRCDWPLTSVLFVGEYNGRGATREQFVQVFKSSEIHVLFRNEVTAIDVGPIGIGNSAQPSPKKCT